MTRLRVLRPLIRIKSELPVFLPPSEGISPDGARKSRSRAKGGRWSENKKKAEAAQRSPLFSSYLVSLPLSLSLSLFLQKEGLNWT